jgi:phosphoglycolate phosphatase-like HAD superfamily hydrolase
MIAYLFDIDGTLIRSGGAGVAALRHALWEDFDVGPAAETTEISGRTDRAIARDLFAAHGVEDSEENWERFQAGYLRRLLENLPKFEGLVLPGVVELLEALGNRDDAAVGLLTGNMEAGARAKLEYFDLWHHFSFGTYGDRRLDRDDLARDAFDLLKERFDGRIAPQQVWVIGDTPHDIRCGQAIGARVLAVATGSHTPEQLAPCRPDVVLHDLAPATQVLSLITP